MASESFVGVEKALLLRGKCWERFLGNRELIYAVYSGE
jgi:hypothetical protein